MDQIRDAHRLFSGHPFGGWIQALVVIVGEPWRQPRFWSFAVTDVPCGGAGCG